MIDFIIDEKNNIFYNCDKCNMDKYCKKFSYCKLYKIKNYKINDYSKNNMSPCLGNCSHSVISKAGISPGGKQKYVVTCKKYKQGMIIDYDEQYEIACKIEEFNENLFSRLEGKGK